MKSLLVLMAFLPIGCWGQDTLFTADLQLLSRGEIRNGGMNRNTDEPTVENKSAFILDRERITLNYQRAWLEAKDQYLRGLGQADHPQRLLRPDRAYGSEIR